MAMTEEQKNMGLLLDRLMRIAEAMERVAKHLDGRREMDAAADAAKGEWSGHDNWCRWRNELIYPVETILAERLQAVLGQFCTDTKERQVIHTLVHKLMDFGRLLPDSREDRAPTQSEVGNAILWAIRINLDGFDWNQILLHKVSRVRLQAILGRREQAKAGKAVAP